MKNPFVEGDVLLFQDSSGVAAAWTALNSQGTFEDTEGYLCGIGGLLERSREFDGPYRVTQTEDWSNYNFEESSE